MLVAECPFRPRRRLASRTYVPHDLTSGTRNATWRDALRRAVDLAVACGVAVLGPTQPQGMLDPVGAAWSTAVRARYVEQLRDHVRTWRRRRILLPLWS